MAKRPDAVDIAAQQRAREQAEVEQAFQKGITTLRDLVAPSSLEIHSSHFRLGTKYGRTIYVYAYPRQIYTGWLSSIINIDEVLDVSMYFYPVESEVVLKNLRKKVTQMQATMAINTEKGRTRDPGLEAALSDAEELRDEIQVGSERFFRYGLYITMYADSLDELNFVQHKIETIFGQQLVFSKVASSQQEQGLNSTVPQMTDQLQIRRNMNTGAISTSFPFTSADLTQEKGILYGINMHNNGLIIFDRFTLENANMVVFAKSGSGKSFTVKLEAVRSMMMGADVLIIDPENEYQKLSDAVGGSYIRLSLNSDVRVNPFDLPRVIDTDEADDALRANLVTLHGLLRLMLGGANLQASGATNVAAMTPAEEADLDQALIDTYARAGITSDPLTHSGLPPTMVDLYDTLIHMEGSGPALAQRLRKYTTGTFAGIFSQQSNIDINNQMVVFNIRDLEDELRPVAMYIVLSHIWNVTRSHLKKRMLIVDEAWQLMKYEDSANFLFSLAKRARKYYLGVTTISQDVEDFMASKMGRAIVANSSMQLLLKQSPSAVDVLADVFKLTDEERKRLSNFPVGQGLFFAGANHVHVQVVASRTEHELVTTNPVQQLQQEEQKRMEELAKQRQAQQQAAEQPEGMQI
ncbi:MAG: Type secretory pathway VirB4 component-like protein [Candidatus Saccharibacteria bacterium]|nr:Type secretory pathway VirB4 component-like protein [Candidatus Saccharibacteria bacterium]